MTDDRPSRLDYLRKPVAEAKMVSAPLAVVEGDAAAQLSHNINLALKRQGEILSAPITGETPVNEKRVVADVAHQSLKVGLQVDETRLRAQQDDVWLEIAKGIAQERETLAARGFKFVE